jgi:hypothetical protein
MLACDSCTTRKWAPFQVGANLEPLYEPLQLVIRLLRVLIPAPPTVSLAGHLPWFDTLKQGGERLTTFPVLPTHLNNGMPVRLASAYTPMALRRRAHTEKKGNRPSTFWLEPTAAWAHRELRGFHRQFTCVVHAEFAWPSHRTAANSVNSSLVAKMSRLSRSTLSPRLHTRRSPIAHARVGNCWSYSRSRLQPPMFRLLNVTRQERALPSTTCADLRPADGDTCRTFRVLIPASSTAPLTGCLH